MLTAASLANYMGRVPGVDYGALFPWYLNAQVMAGCTNVRRSAAWGSQLKHESGGLRYMAEIQTSGPGWSWDRTRYRGRGPIQLTWSGNYRKFGIWCKARGLVDDQELFVQQPELVEQPKWGFLAAAFYWQAGGPRPGRINDFADQGDILAVSRCVNGWIEGRLPNHFEERRQAWELALSMGDALVPDSSQQSPVQGVPIVGVSGDPFWLKDVLLEALGSRLIVEPGWDERGNGDVMGENWGVMIHHTGNDRETVAGIRDGRSDLAGPLSQCLILPNGTVHLIAVGPCNHAGIGNYPGIAQDTGNDVLIGFECAWPYIRPDGSYDPGQRWPDKQIISMRDATAGVLRYLKKDASRVIGHKEYARNPPNVKWDPGNMDMNWFRGEVQKDLNGFVFPGETPPITNAPPANTTPPSTGNPPAQNPATPPANPTADVWDQVAGRWERLGWRTQVEMLSEIYYLLTGIDNRGLPGFTRGAHEIQDRPVTGQPRAGIAANVTNVTTNPAKKG